MTEWTNLPLPEIATLPRPVYMRASELPAKSRFRTHAHAWDQLVYASAGVLEVDTQDNRFIIPPEQAVWLPAGLAHATTTAVGAMFRSLYIDPVLSRDKNLSGPCRVLGATPLVREMITKAVTFPTDYAPDSYPARFFDVLLDELSTMVEISVPLPWPQDEKLKILCAGLYADPADPRTLKDWGRELGVSPRTLVRHLERETGLSVREWRHRLRIVKGIEFLSQGQSVTATAMMLGYGAPSAFIEMFKAHFGQTPLQFVRASSP